MSSSAVDICNKALTRLGVTQIASFTENSKVARLATSHYDSLRRQELRKHPWAFAIKRVSLAKSTEVDPFGEDNIFIFPADWIRTLPLA